MKLIIQANLEENTMMKNNERSAYYEINHSGK